MSNQHPLNQQARRLRKLLHDHRVELSVHDTQTLVARSHGHRNWQAAKAAHTPQPPTPAPVRAYLVRFHEDLDLSSDAHLIVNGQIVDTISSEDPEVEVGTARYFVSQTLRALTGGEDGPDPVQDLLVTVDLAAQLNLQAAEDDLGLWEGDAALAAWVVRTWEAQQRPTPPAPRPTGVPAAYDDFRYRLFNRTTQTYAPNTWSTLDALSTHPGGPDHEVHLVGVRTTHDPLARLPLGPGAAPALPAGLQDAEYLIDGHDPIEDPSVALLHLGWTVHAPARPGELWTFAAPGRNAPLPLVDALSAALDSDTLMIDLADTTTLLTASDLRGHLTPESA